MVRAIDVTRRLVELSYAGEEPDPLTPLRLHKLLYYAQGWHLAAFGTPLFDERIEAWKHGPVVAPLFSAFAGSADCISPEKVPAGAPLPARQLLLVNAIWAHYARYSAGALRNMTHEEPPWRSARRRAGAGEGEKCCEEITAEEMRQYFAQLATKNTVSGLDIGACYRGMEEFERGDGMSFREGMAELMAKPRGR